MIEYRSLESSSRLPSDEELARAREGADDGNRSVDQVGDYILVQLLSGRSQRSIQEASNMTDKIRALMNRLSRFEQKMVGLTISRAPTPTQRMREILDKPLLQSSLVGLITEVATAGVCHLSGVGVDAGLALGILPALLTSGGWKLLVRPELRIMESRSSQTALVDSRRGLLPGV
jgi:hypothetical protein